MTATTTDDDVERPENVPDNFRRVNEDGCGYGVRTGDLWAAADEAILDLTPSGIDRMTSSYIAMEAARTHPDVPTAVGECIEYGRFRGDASDLSALIDALKHYEDHEAGIGEDKIAYDMRTACNHAKRAVEDALADD